jgi:predicted RecB family nuclease
MKTLVDPAEFRKLLPAKDEGDLFIDYEWFLPTGESTELVYMLSATDWNEQFFPFVAKTKEEEVEAFKGFVAFLVERSKKYPKAHFYHFQNGRKD